MASIQWSLPDAQGFDARRGPEKGHSRLRQ